MKKKAKLLAMSFVTLMITIGYSKLATAAASCAIISGRFYCW